MKTQDQLRNALKSLIPDRSGKVEVDVCKVRTERVQGQNRSVSVSFHGEIWWWMPREQGGLLLVNGCGETLLDAYIACKEKLAREIEERCRRRKLTKQSNSPAAALPAPPPRRLEYQP